MKQEFTDAGWQAKRVLNETSKAPDFYLQSVQQIKMDEWSNDRVVCLVDATLASTLLTYIDTSLALIGSYMLCW